MLQHDRDRITEVIKLIQQEKKIGFELKKGAMLREKNETQKWVVGF